MIHRRGWFNRRWFKLRTGVDPYLLDLAVGPDKTTTLIRDLKTSEFRPLTDDDKLERTGVKLALHKDLKMTNVVLGYRAGEIAHRWVMGVAEVKRRDRESDGRLLWWATRILPDRDRWVTEWLAELGELPLSERSRFLRHLLLFGVLKMAISLRVARLRRVR